MNQFIKCTFWWFFLSSTIAIAGCKQSTGKRESEKAQINALFTVSKVQLPANTSFVNWGVRGKHMFALLCCPDPVSLLLPNGKEDAAASVQTTYEGLKSRSGNYDMGETIPGSSRFFRAVIGNDLWYQDNLQTSKGYFVHIEIFIGKAPK
jgi:hypothetical protein